MSGAGRDGAAIEAAAAFLRASGFGGEFDLALVLGTGLGSLADAVAERVAVPYAAIPHFPVGGVSGHLGQLVAGRWEGRRVLVFQGRAHYYEGGDAGAMRVPIGAAAALGAPILLLTNAAGSIRPGTGPGSLALISDHINLAGANPLIGESAEARFVALDHAYDRALRGALRRAAQEAGVGLDQGVYAWFSGPSFETPAEVRMARLLGAAFVGMSTVPEAILGRFHGLRVAAISVITNLATGIAPPRWTPDHAPVSHGETKTVAARAAADLGRVIEVFLRELDRA